MKKSARIDLPAGRFLRLLSEADVNQDYVDALNNKDRTKYMTSVHNKVSHEDAVRYIRENAEKSDTLLFGVFEGDCLLGTSRLHDIDQKNGTAQLGIFIFSNDPSKKGLGTSMIEKISDFAFSELRLEAVHAGIFVENEASIRAFTKAGFSVHDHSTYQGRQYQKWIKRRPV